MKKAWVDFVVVDTSLKRNWISHPSAFDTFSKELSEVIQKEESEQKIVDGGDSWFCWKSNKYARP